jgi:D-alanine-D-alanine ligase
VTVLAGGPSAEREVSLASGQAVAEALRRRGHDVLLTDIGPDNLAALGRDADVVFPALHGTFGEDGTIQRIMEQRGIRFVGSGSQASALAIDKVATKRVATDLGIPTPAYEVVTPPGEPTLPLPVVVKPIAQGSSVGTTIVRDARELTPTVQAVAGTYGRALVERFVPGDELTVGILGEQTLPPICIQPSRDFYDYEAKYRDEHTEYLFESGHSSALLERLSGLSRRIFKALGCRHLARVDWMVEPDGRPWFLEVNTLPGFTSHSLVPKAAERIGIPFDELVERLVRMALEDPS